MGGPITAPERGGMSNAHLLLEHFVCQSKQQIQLSILTGKWGETDNVRRDQLPLRSCQCHMTPS